MYFFARMRRIFQYIQRWANIYLAALPGRYQSRKIEILQHLFREVNGLLRKSGEEYWLDFGTLLGNYRENGIIPHDIDVDFGMHERSYEKVLNLKSVLPASIKFYDTSQNHRGPKIYFSYKGFDVDIYFYEDLGENLRSYENSRYPNETTPIPKSLIFPLQKSTHLNEPTFVPSQTKAYLEHVYGYIGKDAVRDPETGYWKKSD